MRAGNGPELIAALMNPQTSEHFIRTDSMDQRVHAVIAFMRENLHRRLSVQEITQTVNLSPSRLREVFKKETGTSLVRYLRNLRMQQARDLLETTFLSVKEIAAKGGHNSVGQFPRNFQQAYCQTPSPHRARHDKTRHAKSHG